MPIVANYMGLYLETRIQDFVRVRFLEIDGEDEIVLESLDDDLSPKARDTLRSVIL